ncbi:hypothetical protein [Friedmanniella luteola]|uniref:hypothetical protein n=1 Tax=Friedmanniella luteola TaxID=546871 RepID=UPI0012FD565E|nr:hypothetical protein [Friedmanniella luteola]
MQLRGVTLTRGRVVPAAVSVVLVGLGALLPYLRMQYLDFTVQVVDARLTLFPAATLVRGVDPQWLPAADPARLPLALNVFNLGASMHQIGAVLAVLLCWALVVDEINKFFWWPLHLAGWVLALGFVPLWAGLAMLRSAGVVAGLGVGWVPLTLAGVVILVSTFRAHARLDTYGGI